ncbi:NAD(P)/FAD-dependent oxidoreductase [Scrofimicrobium canadense]|uniref:NAD(P)/FAD-dependent oxidoreductase n=1 Tax=Scrofimicrobium canadense TaxID=2652290 RepID=UPI00197E16AD|nr:NAD(P)/FAD-dependent oxidoreductase [Scrofimicrobium canadense]
MIDSGEPRNRYASHMHGVLGNEGTPPGELLRTGREEIRLYGGRVINPTVESVSDCDGGVKVILADGSTYIARALIVATGVDDALPAIPGLQERWGSAVFHCPYCHGWEVKDQHIGVLATSPASLHHAQLARQWSDQVTVFTANLGPLDPDEEKKLRSRGIRLVSAKVTHVVGQGNTIDFVRTSTGQEIDLDAILLAPQTIPRNEFLDDLALSRTELPFSSGSVLEVDPTGKTRHPRIWAIGNW